MALPFGKIGNRVARRKPNSLIITLLEFNITTQTQKVFVMAYSAQELGQLFGAAVKTLNDNRKKINEFDDHNGNHSDNMVHNLQVI